MPGVPSITGALLVLADVDLLAESAPQHRCGHLRALRRELGLPVPTDEEDVRVERLCLVMRESVDEQPLSLLDAVLLAPE